MYQSVKAFSSEQSEQYNRMKFNQLYNKINADLALVVQIGQLLRNNEEIVGYLHQYENPESDFAAKQLVVSKMTNLLLSYKAFSPLIRNISVLSDSKQFSADVQYLFPIPMTQSTGQDAELDNVYSDADGSLYLYSTMSDRAAYSFIIQLETDYFAELVQKHAYLMLYNPNGPFIRSGDAFRDVAPESLDPGPIPNGLNDEIMYSYHRVGKVYVKPFDNFHWRLAYMEQTLALADHLSGLKRISVTIFAIATVIAVAVAKPISIKVTGPLGNLIRSIDRYEPIAASRRSETPLSSRSFIRGATVYFVIAIFVPVAIYMALFYAQSYKKINDDVKNGYMASFDEAVENVERYLKQKELIASSIASKRGVQDILLHQESPGKWNEFLREYARLGLAHDHMAIIDRNRNLLFSNLALADNPFEATAPQREDSFIRNGNNEIKWRYESNGPVLQLTKEIRDVYSQGFEMNVIGFLHIDIDKQDLWQQFDGFKTNNNEVFLLNPFDRSLPGGTVAALQAAFAGISFDQDSQTVIANLGETKQLFFVKKLDAVPLLVVSKYRYADIYKKNNFLINNIFFVTVITFLVTLILSFALSLKLIHPLAKLNKRIQEIRMLGDLSAGTESRYYIDEIDTLLQSFTDMTQRIEHLFDQLLVSGMKNNRLMSEKNKAEIHALQAQIKPHFLYNTLETINGLILENRKEDAMTMINCLSDLFRLSISKKEFQGLLTEELQHAQAYAAIMSIRYSNQLAFEWAIEESALHCQVMMFIMQPLIENAIYHGVQRRHGAKSIRIGCREVGDELLFSVKDDGIGIPEIELQNIRYRLHSQPNGQQSGFGLYSVNLRLKLYYGEECGLQVSSTYGEGTIVTYKIPRDKSAS